MTTFISLSLAGLLMAACGDKDGDTGEFDPGDGGTADGGTADGGTEDGGATDGGATDGGATDGGSSDGGSSDGGSSDGGSSDGGATDGGSSDGGGSDGGTSSSGCSEYFPVDEEGVVWTYETTNERESFTWTQSISAPDGDHYILVTSQPGAETTTTYTCEDGRVDLIESVSVAPEGTATMTFSTPWTVWASGEPKAGMSWVSIGEAAYSFDYSGGSITGTAVYTGEWEILEVDTEYVHEDGTKYPGAVSFSHENSQEIDGRLQTRVEELAITSPALPGLLWSDSVTYTIAGGGKEVPAESTTVIVSVEGP